MENSMNLAKDAVAGADAVPAWLLWVVGLLVVVAAVFFVVLPLLRKYKRKQLKVKETKEIKKDLMIWHHLAQLVRGGNEHQKAKQKLSDQIVKINVLFKQGLNLLEMHGRKLYEQPVFMIVGEPMSGKSTLLRNSELELVASGEEESADGEERKSLPLRLWLGAKAVVCDVNGHVFFDRWLNGSSAEWNYIGRLLHRKRNKKPLDGIIITIPADALLADDEALSQQKAILMTTEIGQLLHTVGMRLPCYVVVTKTDMVNGFDEYVLSMNDDLRTQIFGWANDGAGYSAQAFKTFWDGLIDRLRSGCAKSMLSRNVAAKLSMTANRMDITSKIYLFPENFDKLYRNLSVYLRALFGEGNFHGADDARLEGVFFTAAKFGDVTLSPSYARLCNRPVEEAPVPHEPVSAPRPYFIRELLRKIVFRVSPDAVFTRREQIKRNVPKYLLCLLMLTIGSGWLAAAWLKTDKLKNSLEAATEYYASLTPVLQQGGVFDSPLIKKTEKGTYVLNGDPVKGGSFSRLQLFFEAYSERETENVAPFGFKTASLAVFGRDKDMGYNDKAFIFNQLQAIMVRMPVIKDVGEKIISDTQFAELNSNKREVIKSFAVLDSVVNEDFTALFAAGDFQLKPLLRYLLPEIPGDTMTLLDSFLTRYDRKYTMTMDPAYIHSSEFFAAQRTGLDNLLTAWKNLTAYPQSTYSTVKRAVDLSAGLEDSYRKLTENTAGLEHVATVEQLDEIVTNWDALVARQADQVGEMNHLVQRLKVSDPFRKDKDNASGNYGVWGNSMSMDALLRFAARDYRKQFEDDFEFVYDETENFPIQPQDMKALQNAIKGQEESVSKKLTREAADLRDRINGLKDNPLFRWRFTEKSSASGYTFRIWNQLYSQAASLTMPDEKTLRDTDFKTNWMQSQRAIKKAVENFDALAETYKDNKDIAEKAAEIRKMLLAKADLIRIAVLDSELRKLPESQAEMYALVEQRASNGDVFDFSGDLAREAIGDLQYAKGYDPLTAKHLLENVFSIARPYMKNKQFGPQDILPTTFMREYSRYDERLVVFEKYLDSFLRYWGDFADGVYAPAGTWAEYKHRLETLKAFKVNSLLQNVYAHCLSILKGIDDTFLSDAVKSQKAEYVALVNDKLSLLTPLFSDAGQKTLNAWAGLPDDSEQAWKTLSAMSERELKNSFFNVYATAPHSKIGWWNAFIDNGVELLRHENETKLEGNFRHILKGMGAFPLCKNCGAKKTVTPKEMRNLASLLRMVSSTPDNSGNDSLIDRNLTLFKDKNSLDWAGDILKIADLLTNQKKPLVWTLYQAPVELQNSLLSKKDVSAVNRFRAVDVVAGGVKNTARVSTAMTADTKIGQGRADSSITLNFYKLSGDETPEARVRFADYWAIFKIYLQNGGRYDAANGKLYIPLTVKDKTGAKFVYFVTVTFNREIFTPDEWPTRQDWENAEKQIAD